MKQRSNCVRGLAQPSRVFCSVPKSLACGARLCKWPALASCSWPRHSAPHALPGPASSKGCTIWGALLPHLDAETPGPPCQLQTNARSGAHRPRSERPRAAMPTRAAPGPRHRSQRASVKPEEGHQTAPRRGKRFGGCTAGRVTRNIVLAAYAMQSWETTRPGGAPGAGSARVVAECWSASLRHLSDGSAGSACVGRWAPLPRPGQRTKMIAARVMRGPVGRAVIGAAVPLPGGWARLASGLAEIQPATQALAQGVMAGDRRSLSRAITLSERR